MVDPPAEGDGSSKPVADCEFSRAPPSRINFAHAGEYRLAFWSWVCILVLLVGFSVVQIVIAVKRWNVYNARDTDRLQASKYLGSRIPYLDVCEDRHGLGPEKPEPAFIQRDETPGMPRIWASCSWFLNGNPHGKSDVSAGGRGGDYSVPAERIYYEPRTLTHPRTWGRIWREEAPASGVNRYRCYRFLPPQLNSTGDDDRVMIKWRVNITGRIAPTRIIRPKRPMITGLLYRVSLAQDPENGWAFHREGMHAAMHKAYCDRTILVNGQLHEYKWLSSFGTTSSVRNQTNAFDVVGFDAESGCYNHRTSGELVSTPRASRQAPAQSSGSNSTARSSELAPYTFPGEILSAAILFRVAYTTLDVSSTEYVCDSAYQLMLTVASCVAMISLLQIVGYPFVSVKKTDPDLLQLRWQIFGIGAPSAAEEDEKKPLLGAE